MPSAKLASWTTSSAMAASPSESLPAACQDPSLWSLPSTPMSHRCCPGIASKRDLRKRLHDSRDFDTDPACDDRGCHRICPRGVHDDYFSPRSAGGPAVDMGTTGSDCLWNGPDCV